MRNTNEMLQFTNLLQGIVNATGTTAQTFVGAPIDTLNFADMMGVLLIGDVFGTKGNGVTVAVKFQEAATMAAVTTDWSDITDGAIMGTVAFTSAVVVAGTTEMFQAKLYERLDSGVRKRFIRPVASVTGTAGLAMLSLGVGVLLGRPRDSAAIGSATTKGTDNSEFSGAAFYSTY